MPDLPEKPEADPSVPPAAAGNRAPQAEPAMPVQDEALLAAEAAARALELRQAGEIAAARALELKEAAARAQAELAHRRLVRRTNVFVLCVGLVVVATMSAMRMPDAADLARGKPWRASSKFLDCHPERIECGGVRTGIFFHTREENQPWVEIDLGAPTRFRGVTVMNRSDAVPERAVPLVLEVGDDQKTWKVLATQNEQFHAWKATFEPVTARYVRLRSPRTTFLHLDAVKVLP